MQLVIFWIIIIVHEITVVASWQIIVRVYVVTIIGGIVMVRGDVVHGIVMVAVMELVIGVVVVVDVLMLMTMVVILEMLIVVATIIRPVVLFIRIIW